jgi:hypothetical protein
LLQEKTKPRHHEPETHEREACANPRKKRSLGGEVVAYVTIFG